MFQSQGKTQSATRKHGRTGIRGVPIILIVLICVAAVIKVKFYTSQFFGSEALGDPLPLSESPLPVHRPPQDQSHDSTSDQKPAGSDTSDDTHVGPGASGHANADDKGDGDKGNVTRPHPIPPRPRPRPGLHRGPPRWRTWKTFRTENFAAANMSISKNGSDITKGYIFTSPSVIRTEYAGPQILTDDSELVWRGPAGASTNLRIQKLDGESVLTYWQTEHRITQGHGYGGFYVYDNTYQLKYTVCPPIRIRRNTQNHYHCNLDMHNALMTDHGTVLATVFNVTEVDLRKYQGPEHGWVYDAQFYEIDVKTQEIVNKWSSLEHEDRIPLNISHNPVMKVNPNNASDHTRGFGESPRRPWDYFHINSVQPFGEGYLVNSRASWSIFSLFKNGTVDWWLQGQHGGDFTLDLEAQFRWEHDSRAVSHNDTHVELMLFNNGVSGFSRTVERSYTIGLLIDLKKKHVSLTRKLIDETAKNLALAMGNWQSLPNDHILVNYGHAGVIKEFNENNELIFNADFGSPSSRSFGASFSSFKYEWHAEPYYPPKVVGEQSAKENKTAIWMSWNGATDYDTWHVFAGDKHSHLEKIDTIDRTGFETNKNYTGVYLFVKAEAANSTGTIRSSAVTKSLDMDVNEYSPDDPLNNGTATGFPAYTHPGNTGQSNTPRRWRRWLSALGFARF